MSATADPPDELDAVLVTAHRCAALFADRVGLHPRALPAALAHHRGAFRDAPVTLSARAWSGSGVGYARVVTIAGPELSIANVLGYPAPDRGLPILGVDVVAVAGTPVVVVADLSPTVPDHLDETLAVLERHRRLHPRFPPRCPRPCGPHSTSPRSGSARRCGRPRSRRWRAG